MLKAVDILVGGFLLVSHQGLLLFNNVTTLLCLECDWLILNTATFPVIKECAHLYNHLNFRPFELFLFYVFSIYRLEFYSKR